MAIVFFYQALKEVLSLKSVIRENCSGCKSLMVAKQHDLCMMTGYGLQLYQCVQEALNRVSRKRLMTVMLDLVKQSDTDFESVFSELFLENDPLEQIKYDTEKQLEFVCYLLDKPVPVERYTIRNRMNAICNVYDFEQENDT